MVEGTAGNTGIGLAHMCLAMGYKCVIYMPNNQSQVSKVCLYDHLFVKVLLLIIFLKVQLSSILIYFFFL